MWIKHEHIFSPTKNYTLETKSAKFKMQKCKNQPNSIRIKGPCQWRTLHTVICVRNQDISSFQ